MNNALHAPGHPGIPPRWTTSAKNGVGTALSHSSRVWFTLSHGIFDEIYYPRADQACTRDLGLIVADGAEFFSEEKRDTRQEIERAQAHHVASGVTRAVRVVGESALVAMQTARTAKQVSFSANVVATLAEAEKLLDQH